ncbi:MAG: HAD family hydrolase [Verrucomicrobiota bacterium]
MDAKSESPEERVAVVFDVDGTLYQQKGLRRVMLRKLLIGSLLSSETRKDLLILKRFRKDRETLGQKVKSGFAEAQYRVTGENLGLKPSRVKAAVERWIHREPLRYLKKFRVPGVEEWTSSLRSLGVGLGVYSEYPAKEKVAALGLSFDVIVSSTDAEVDAFKPNPKGIEVVLSKLDTKPENALFVGDRLDRDRPCAEAAGVHFLWVSDRVKGGTSLFPPPESLLPSFLRERSPS